jgi:hypothetical protein
MVPGELDDINVQAVLSTARCALGAEGLWNLRWECFLPAGLAPTTLPINFVKPSLRQLSYKLCGDLEPLHYLLSCHASTLEAVELTMRSDVRNVATALAALVHLPRLMRFALRVEGNVRTDMQVVKHILLTASAQLRSVELQVIHHLEVELVKALGIGRRAAVQNLDLSGPKSPTTAEALSSSLKTLLHLEKLRLRCVALPCFLHFILSPGGAAHKLRRLELSVPANLCPHLYAHSIEVQALLRANTLLTVALRAEDGFRWATRSFCGVCVYCEIGCHSAAVRPLLGLLELNGQDN